MSNKFFSLGAICGLIAILSSCSETDTLVSVSKNPDTGLNPSNLSYPASYVFKNTVIPETEYYQVMQKGQQKITEPYYMRYSKNLLKSSIKDDHSLPFKEIRFAGNDKLTIVYKDSSVVENNEYYIENDKDLYIKSSGYLGSFNKDKTSFSLNLGAYTYSNASNSPMYPRLYLNGCYSPDKSKSIEYLVTSQSLLPGDTLAINFTQMVYERKLVIKELNSKVSVKTHKTP